MGFFSDDIVRDILQRVIDASAREGGFGESLAHQIERQVRQEWGGSKPYIPHDHESRRIVRDEKILSEWADGQHDTKQLATRFGLSERQVRRIVRG